MRETWFEAFLMDLGLGPGKRGGIGVIGLDKGIDVLSELFDRGEGSAVQRLSFQDREPDFHLIEPGGPRRREVEMNVRVAPEPTIVPGLVGVEIVEDDVDGRVRVSGDDIVHEIEELDAPPPRLVRGGDLAGRYLEGGKQGGGAVALVIVAMAGQRPAVRELEIALRSLQRLDRGLLVDTDDDRVLGRRHIEPDHVGGLGYELGIVALTPKFAPGEVDLLRAQQAPDMLDIDIAERGRQQRPCPAGIALGRRLIQQRQDALVRLCRVLRLSAPLARFVEARKPLPGVANPPLRRRAGCTSNRSSNRPARNAVRCQQHDPRPLPQPVLRLRRTRQALKLGTFLRRQNDNCRLRDAAHASLNYDLCISDSWY